MANSTGWQISTGSRTEGEEGFLYPPPLFNVCAPAGGSADDNPDSARGNWGWTSSERRGAMCAPRIGRHTRKVDSKWSGLFVRRAGRRDGSLPVRLPRPGVSCGTHRMSCGRQSMVT